MSSNVVTLYVLRRMSMSYTFSSRRSTICAVLSPVTVILRSPETATLDTTPSRADLPPKKFTTLPSMPANEKWLRSSFFTSAQAGAAASATVSASAAIESWRFIKESPLWGEGPSILRQDVREGLVDICVSERKSEISSAYRHRALSAQEQRIGHFAERQAQRKRRRGKHARTLQDPAE